MRPTFEDILQYRGRAALRSDSRARRKAILEAALRVIERDGVRGVKHRAVAAEAEVPLAATTYYFDDIQSLLHDAFVHYVETRLSDNSTSVQNQAYLLIQQFDEAPGVSVEQRRHRLIEGIVDLLFDYVLLQVGQTADRRVEVAFRHEALCNEDLAAVIAIPHGIQLQAIEECLTVLKSQNPQADAQVVMGTLLYLEYDLSLHQNDERYTRAREALRRMMTGLLGLSGAFEIAP